MSTDAWWTIRQALVEYRDKDFSSATNDQIHAMTDALAADLESQLTAQQPAPVSATEPECVARLREYSDTGSEGLYTGRQRPICDVSDVLDYIDTLRARVAELERVTPNMRETMHNVVRDSLVNYRDKDFSLKDNTDIAELTDEWATELVDEICALTAARGGG